MLDIVFAEGQLHDHWDDRFSVERSKAEVIHEIVENTCEEKSEVRCDVFLRDSEPFHEIILCDILNEGLLRA